MTAAEFCAVMDGFGRFHGGAGRDGDGLRDAFHEALADEFAAGRA